MRSRDQQILALARETWLMCPFLHFPGYMLSCSNSSEDTVETPKAFWGVSLTMVPPISVTLCSKGDGNQDIRVEKTKSQMKGYGRILEEGEGREK